MDDIKGHVVVKQVIDVDYALYFTQIDHRDEKLRHSHHLHPLLAASHEVQNHEYGVSRGQHHQIES